MADQKVNMELSKDEVVIIAHALDNLSAVANRRINAEEVPGAKAAYVAQRESILNLRRKFVV